MATRPFRVLFVDDQITRPDKRTAQGGDPSTQAIVALGGQVDALGGKRRAPLPIEIYSTTAPSNLKTAGECYQETIATPRWDPKLLPVVNVLVLDLGIENDPSLPMPAGFPNTADWDGLCKKYVGAAWFLANREALLGCHAVFFLSQYDGTASVSLVEKYVDPLCTASDSGAGIGPHIAKYPKGGDGPRRVADRIFALFESYADGFSDLTRLDAIEFAASNDLPVMIVGESGTGKENVARSIHRRWAQERELDLSAAGAATRQGSGNEVTPRKFVPVNCAGMSAKLANGDLFGVVAGAYTDAERHRAGVVLQACGIAEFPLDGEHVHSELDFRNRLRRANAGALTESGSDLVLEKTARPGTLFLDEFAELPLQVQLMLLRFIEYGEVRPLGASFVIKNVRPRILVATSDPRVAAFAGEELHATRRSKEELARPLRDDLLFRVRALTIRTPAVTAANAHEVLERLLEAAGASEAWDGTARTAVVRLVEQAYEHGRPFGHRRELKQIIELANEFVQTARRRGVRSGGDKVTGDLIERLWTPVLVYDGFKSGGGDARRAAREQIRAALGLEVDLEADTAVWCEAVRALPSPDKQALLVALSKHTGARGQGKKLDELTGLKVASIQAAIRKLREPASPNPAAKKRAAAS